MSGCLGECSAGVRLSPAEKHVRDTNRSSHSTGYPADCHRIVFSRPPLRSSGAFPYRRLPHCSACCGMASNPIRPLFEAEVKPIIALLLPSCALMSVAFGASRAICSRSHLRFLPHQTDLAKGANATPGRKREAAHQSVRWRGHLSHVAKILDRCLWVGYSSGDARPPNRVHTQSQASFSREGTRTDNLNHGRARNRAYLEGGSGPVMAHLPCGRDGPLPWGDAEQPPGGCQDQDRIVAPLHLPRGPWKLDAHIPLVKPGPPVLPLCQVCCP